jgi:dTDP-4-dehydrorhamnose 3,5-epimerase
MTVTEMLIPEVLVIEPRIFEDARGAFFEAYNQQEFSDAGICCDFVQDNQSVSRKHVLRGLHYQIHQPQGKLVRVLRGDVLDVAVDCRRSSKHFGQFVAITLSSENRKMLWIPEGFAHGFLVLSETAEVFYKTTNFYSPQHERTLVWNDPQIAIPWPCKQPILSDKDLRGQLFANGEMFE